MDNIRLLAMDVDGTMTDGKIYVGRQGEVMKAFCVKDGYGIRILREMGIIPAIITARSSEIVENRARELSITEVYQGVQDKVEVLRGLCEKHGISPETMAYVGDDLPDLPAIRYVGHSFCPSDSAAEVRSAAAHVLRSKGGEGVIREVAEFIGKRMKQGQGGEFHESSRICSNQTKQPAGEE